MQCEGFAQVVNLHELKEKLKLSRVSEDVKTKKRGEIVKKYDC